MATINWSLQHKRDTAANWTANNPILLAGQIGIETDNLTTTPKFKIGDGTTAWNTLPYFYGGALSAQNLNNVLSVGSSTSGQDMTITADDQIKFGSGNAVIFNDSTETDSNHIFLATNSAISGYSHIFLKDGGNEFHDESANAYMSFFVGSPPSASISLDHTNNGKIDIFNGTGGLNLNGDTYLPSLTASRLLSLDANNKVVNETGTGFLKLNAGVISYDSSTYLTTSAAALTYQPLDSDLTSWASVTRASGFDTFATTPSSANLAYLVTDETGSGALVFGTSPTFTTDITTPLIIGGTAVGSTIQYKGTTGNGTSTVAAHQFLVGNNGATTAAQVFNSGQVSIGNYASPTNLRTLTIGQDTAYASFGSLVGTTSAFAIYALQATPSSSNYSLGVTSSSLLLNTTNSIYLQRNGTSLYYIENSGITHGWSCNTVGVGAYTSYTFNVPVHTGQTASTEISNFRVNGASKTWAAGNITTQRWNYFTANTAAFASASTITNSYGLYVEAATAGTNATITKNYAIGALGYIKQDSSTSNGILIGDLIGTTTQSAIYLNKATPSASNYAIRGGASNDTYLNGGSGGVNITINGSAAIGTFLSTSINFSPANAGAATAITPFTFTSPSGAAQTASTEIPILKVVGNTTTWSAGNITNQRWNYLTAHNAAFSSASTITNSYGLYVEAATAGTNATITNNWALGGNGSFSFSDGTRSLNYTLAAASTLIQTAETSSIIRVASGTRTLQLENYAADANYITSSGSALRIRTNDSQTLQLWTNNTARLTVNATGGFTIADANDFTFNATTGTKIGTGTTQKIGFWNAAPIVQPTTSVTAATFVANTSGIVNDTATFDGYTIGQVVKALRNIGLLA